MPNKIYFTSEYHAKTSTGKHIRAFKRAGNHDIDEWEIVVSDGVDVVREYSGWDEVRVLAFMEFFESGD